ncbi:V-type proton ATPase subunit C 1-A, partial [Taenia solium]
VGTLDVLVGISDELVKLDSCAENVTRKIAQYMGDVLEEQRHKLEDNLLVNGLSPSLYISKFQWDTAKYPIKQTLQTLHDILSEGALHALEKKQTGSLLTRNLAEIVKKQQFVLGSEYLITVAVVVPRYFVCTEKKLVYALSRLIFEDQDNGLWTVTLFQKMLNDFTLRAREKRFIVRDFVYDEKAIEESKNMFSKLEADKKKQFPPLFRWLRVNFGEAFSAMMHIKALRIFVESVLRYGLPVDFEAILIVPNRKNYKRLREVLHNMYEHLDNLALSSTTDVSLRDALVFFPSAGLIFCAVPLQEEMVGAGMSHGEYYPYVSISVETNFVDTR